MSTPERRWLTNGQAFALGALLGCAVGICGGYQHGIHEGERAGWCEAIGYGPASDWREDSIRAYCGPGGG